ncbi:uncharacterized protein BXZ73DRAFT_98910 [Epithele typhae]|uniref:uncharacterized protein n=1 Tax=Epithele typhae TaxID=378194 RepID=UPI002007C348|nr:uncharacterized protein BXZ73DRAFT_98910 [Epithele typhae]KAH9940482.1 hypothetical protein BXZ73DRAFT_98910 [Epithele typhae]
MPSPLDHHLPPWLSMISDRMQRTIHVDTTASSDQVRSVFSRSGEIRRIYPARLPGEPGTPGYYVEYRDQPAANAASSLSMPTSMAVHALDRYPKLADRFFAIATSAPPPAANLPQKPPPEVLESAVDADARYPTYLRQISKQATLCDRTFTILEPAPMNGSSFGSYNYYPDIAANGYDENGYNQVPPYGWSDASITRDNNSISDAYMHTNRYPTVSPMSPFTESAPSTSSMASNGTQTQHASTSEPNNTLFLTGGAEIQPINLETLDDSPDRIVASLRTSARHPVDCGKWIMVGASYRGRGNLLAAIAVITAMIEVMSSAGMESAQLKPAVLMLSSCHLEVARHLRAQNGAETAHSTRHLAHACDGFRSVYGAFEPPRPPALLLAPGHPTAGRARARSAAEPAPPRAVPSSPRHGQTRMLEREVQSLRDRQGAQVEQLARTRAEKRKLEEELERAAQRRRRLEDVVDKAEAAEGAAHERARAEEAERRRAEERAEEMRRRVLAAEARVGEAEERERKTREYFGRLGLSFLKASRGDMGDIPAAVRM